MIEKDELYPLIFKPRYKRVMWGGEQMEAALQRKLPKGKVPIGESWELSDRSGDESVVANGKLRGSSIRELLDNYGTYIVGKSYNGGRFPLLVKIIDAGKKLSLQVHPDKQACARIGEGAEPKTEMWYIISAEKGAKILAGLKSNTTKCQFLSNINSTEIEDSLQVFDSVKGDAYFITSGRIHAIGAGNLLLEIQQSSDTTYRVSDWGRVGTNGKPRELHVDKAIESIHFMDRTSPRICGVSDSTERNRKFPIINTCPFFKVDDLRLSAAWCDDTASTQSFHLLTAINNPITVGRGAFITEVPLGMTCLVPASFGEYTINLVADEETVVIKTTL